AFAYHVFQIQQIVVRVLSAEIRRARRRLEGTSRSVIDAAGRHGNDLFLRIAKRGQFAAKDATGIDIDGPIEPFGFGNGSVTIDDHRVSAVVRRPVVANLETELVHLP